MDIEQAIETMQHWIDYEKKNKDKINKADELIEVQETILKELENKDKIIDKLSYSLADYVMYYEYDKCRNPEMIKNKAKELKQYYERKGGR